jgi:hypothetical protein
MDSTNGMAEASATRTVAGSKETSRGRPMGRMSEFTLLDDLTAHDTEVASSPYWCH